jgi:TrmH family RNA methyltransferase
VTDITSRQHPIVRAFRSAARGESDAALLDGWHLLHDAVAAGVAIRTVAVCGAPGDARDAALVADLARQCDVLVVSRAVMDAMSPVRAPAGVVALASRRRSDIADVVRRWPPLVLVASDIQDPGNAGAIVRSAEAGGSTGVIFTGASADPWGWKALRAAMGSTFRLPVVLQPDSAATAAALARAQVRLVAAVPRGGTSMYNIDLSGPVALVLGGEGAGLADAVVRAADARLSIPMQAPVESLNVAVAAALLTYEARRQRGIE